MAEAPINQLPSGYDEDFVNAVEDEVLCLICHLALKEPVLTRCGHRFCKECLEEHFRRQGVQRQTCPADRESLDRDKDVFPDKATERKILSLAIKCPSEGCDWTGELRRKEIHLKSCLFKLVPCINENCHVTARRKDIEHHVIITCQWRIINCKHCIKPHPHCQMQNHIAKCIEASVTCPNNCGRSIRRKLIPNHTKNDCPLTIISCPYEQMGCEIKVQRSQVESHLQSAVRLHLDLACVKINNTEVKLNNTEDKLNNTEVKLNNTEDKLNNTEVKLNNSEETTRKLMQKLDTLNFLRMFVWKINGFSEVLRQAKTGEKYYVESDLFYSESYGYKLKVLVFPNGDNSGENTHLSVYIIVTKGEYDAILPWPFKKKVKFTLIDQQEDPDKRENVTKQFIPDNNPECFARPVEVENTAGYGLYRFISHVKLHSRRYLVDDTLFLQVEVGPSSN